MTELQSYLKPLVQTSDFSVLPLAGDASSRRYYRVVAGDRSWVLMQWEPFQEAKDFPFLSVQSCFANHDVPVPQVFDYDATAGLFLLEDLGDLTLERKFWEFQNQENILPYYKKTLDELIKIHSLHLKKESIGSCTAFDIEFSVEKLMWEFQYMRKHLIQGLLKISLSATEERQINECFDDICQRLYKLPQVVCHRDFHSRNVMIKHGRIFIIDFQDARMGPAVYDLVSLLYDSYVSLKPETISQLLEYYADGFPNFSQIAESRKSFLAAFNLQSLQRCLKACGSFASFFNDRSDERYLKYIEPTLGLVATNLKSFPEYQPLAHLVKQAETAWATK